MKRLIVALLMFTACSTTAPQPRTVPFGGGSIYVDDGGGSGVPIVFIHGNGGNSEQWLAQLDHFRAAGRRAVAVDLPGFGKSTAPPNADYSLPAMTAAVDQAVTSIGLRRFVIVGHSYAGAVVASYAAQHPEKVAGVVYLDAVGATPKLTDQQKEQFFAALRADKMAVVRSWFGAILKPSPQSVQDAVFASAEMTPVESLIGAMISLLTYDAPNTVNAYAGPRLAIVAADLETPTSFQKQFPEVKSVRISGAGHWLMLDKPGEVNAALDEFLRQIR